ncbi:hypothetical protein ACRRTK_003514 [Alexandromys fortis]
MCNEWRHFNANNAEYEGLKKGKLIFFITQGTFPLLTHSFFFKSSTQTAGGSESNIPSVVLVFYKKQSIHI